MFRKDRKAVYPFVSLSFAGNLAHVTFRKIASSSITPSACSTAIARSCTADRGSSDVPRGKVPLTLAPGKSDRLDPNDSKPASLGLVGPQSFPLSLFPKRCYSIMRAAYQPEG